MSHSIRIAPFCVALFLSGMLVGCGAKEDGGKASASQVAARVNKEEISVHQINNLLRRLGNVPQDQVKNATAVALDRLIDQEVMVQKAKEQKLDRNPNVLQLIEFAKRDILARAYGEQVASKVQRPTEAQITAFYDENPALFAKRQVFDLQELNIRVPPDRLDAVRDRIKEAGSPSQLTEWLNEQKLPYQVVIGTKGIEQLPAEMRKLNPGQAVVVNVPTGLMLITIVRARDEPILRDKAKPAIENLLYGKARAELVQQEVKNLRAAATVQYVGEFGPPVKPDPATAAAVAAPAHEPESEQKAGEAPASDEEALRKALEKGLK